MPCLLHLRMKGNVLHSHVHTSSEDMGMMHIDSRCSFCATALPHCHTVLLTLPTCPTHLHTQGI